MREQIIRIAQSELDAQSAYAQQVRALPDRPRTYHIVTFGCQMNAHDSEIYAGQLAQMGMTAAENREEADLVLFNTCCIRDNAERKALGNVTWLKEIKKTRPGMVIGVCGCMAQKEGMAERIKKQYPFVNLVFGTGDSHRLPEYLYKTLSEHTRVLGGACEQSTVAEGLPVLRASAMQAYVTVMYGCDNFCSYCIVPYVRGRERSRKSEDILREIDALVRSGVREIMLLGQNVNSYGAGGDISFAKLLEKAAGTGIERIRFMTSHPKDLSDELIDQFVTNKALCKQLHLPVQSGSDDILQKMNRRYTRAQYLDKVAKLRAAVPDIALSTDLIVAFPGETERDFEDTMALAREVRYDSAYTFIYSPREGTAAAKMDGRIPPDIATRRIEALIAQQEQITSDILSGLIGTTQRVLVEGASRRSEKQLTGKCGRGVNVNFEGEKDSIGQFVNVTITGAGSNTLRGICKEEQS